MGFSLQLLGDFFNVLLVLVVVLATGLVLVVLLAPGLAPLTHGERGKMETIGTTAELEPDNQKAMDVDGQNKECLP